MRYYMLCPALYQDPRLHCIVFVFCTGRRKSFCPLLDKDLWFQPLLVASVCRDLDWILAFLFLVHIFGALEPITRFPYSSGFNNIFNMQWYPGRN
ncbi:hypothetical protein GDO78_019744 [Eleutherodactylus coqui]|uniref:Uncharacterized protein n=1 Tax=Eleutherodactylus coqui TaxID=57060 RepID=A0A8J6BJ70_ELECQ|nr:hypothetical protein GDO78_019744 [Eleutherodactylus coqui]